MAKDNSSQCLLYYPTDNVEKEKKNEICASNTIKWNVMELSALILWWKYHKIVNFMM